MAMIRESWACGALALAAMVCAGCNSGGGSSSVPVVATVIATDPPNGAESVPPAAVIRLVLSDSTAVLSEDDVMITDGGNALRGDLRQVAGSNVWEWTPDHELPRGTDIQVVRVEDSVAPASQEVISTFRVRAGTIDHSLDVAGELPGFALSWPNGRRAIVAASGSVLEMTATGLVRRFVEVPPHARAYGDGSFIGEEVVAGVRHCVRGNLDGSITSVPTPLSVAIGENNANGDVVAFVPPTMGTSTEWGLWRWLHDEPGFVMAGSIASDFAVDIPSIQADGTVSMAYSLVDRVKLSRFAVGDLVGEHHELLVSGTHAHFDSAEDGTGLLAYGVYAAGTIPTVPVVNVHVARYTPGAGLQSLPGTIKSWHIWLTSAGISSFYTIEDVRVGELGSGCVLLANGTTASIGLPGTVPMPETNTHREVVRIEPDGRVDSAKVYLSSRGEGPLHRGLSHVSPARAEIWSVSDYWASGTAWLTQSRPNVFGASVVQKGLQRWVDTDNWCFSFDDSGRGVMALTVGPEGATSMRVLLIN